MSSKRQRKFLLMVLAFSAMFGFWYFRSNILEEHVRPATAIETKVNISVKPTIRKPNDMFAETSRDIRKLLGSKREGYLDDEVKTILKKRRDHVQATCSQIKKKESTAEQVAKGSAFYRNVDTLYCRVAKAASKFWTRMLHVVNTNHHTSPYEFRKAGYLKLATAVQTLARNDRDTFVKKVVNDSFSFMFARNPYKRIFSSYLDKFMSPNSQHWGAARQIIKSVRKSSSKCGSDLTFSELVKFLISRRPKRYDRHFKPVSVICDVCNFEFDVIGKVESFKDDVFYILNQISNTKKVYFKDFAQENSIHYIIFNAKRTFSMRSRLLRCVTQQIIYLRLWRQLQMSGLIEKHYNYPLSPEESQRLNLTSLTNLLLDAYQRSTSGARSNSREAYLQAYREVPLEDLEKLRLKYLKDFMLFDYESRPKELFERNDSVSNENGSFYYFDILNETV